MQQLMRPGPLRAGLEISVLLTEFDAARSISVHPWLKLLACLVFRIGTLTTRRLP
jgi:hypothetical protein